MSSPDQALILAIAMLAASSDGVTSAAEQGELNATASRLGFPDVAPLVHQISAGRLGLADLAQRLPTEEARRLAYQIVIAVIHADGVANPAEQAFLDRLQSVLGLTAAAVASLNQTATALASAPLASGGLEGAPAAAADATVDDLILQQSILTAALEILPDTLANVAVLPLQLRLVYQIGQRSGQKLDANQVKDLAATLGFGAAAQAMEGIVLKVLGGFAGGLFGGLTGGTVRVAAGAAVTFAATYALGHVAQRYYGQGRTLTTADLKALFAQFQQEAHTLFPKIQGQIETHSRTLSLPGVLRMLRPNLR